MILYPGIAWSGMSPNAERRVDRWVDKYGYKRIAKVMTKNGYVFIMEKPKDDGIEVVWACNDFARPILFFKHTSETTRIQVAVADSENELGGKKTS